MDPHRPSALPTGLQTEQAAQRAGRRGRRDQGRSRSRGPLRRARPTFFGPGPLSRGGAIALPINNGSLGNFTLREIVLDTETTGLDPLDGHRIVEIGAVELVNRSLTGQTFHCYLNPERAMPADAVAVHGLSEEFLANKPLFGAVADELLAFVDDAPPLAQNARKRAAKRPLSSI